MQLAQTYGYVQAGREVFLLLAPAGNTEGGSRRKTLPWEPKLANFNFTGQYCPT